MFKSFTKLVAIIVFAVSATGCAINQHQQAGSGSAEFGVLFCKPNRPLSRLTNQEMGLAALGAFLAPPLVGLQPKTSRGPHGLQRCLLVALLVAWRVMSQRVLQA